MTGVTFGDNSPLTKTHIKSFIWGHKRVYVDFFFHLNLLPPYSLRSQGINVFNLIAYFTDAYSQVRMHIPILEEKYEL